MWMYSAEFYDSSFCGPHGYEANNMQTRVWIAPDAFMYSDSGDTFLFVSPETGSKYLDFDFEAIGLRPELVLVEHPQHPVFDGWLQMLERVGYNKSPHETRFLLHNFAAQQGWTTLAAKLPEIDAEYREIEGDSVHIVWDALGETPPRQADTTDLADVQARRAAWKEKYRQAYPI